ncbi:MAG: WecB/TagA/CpsF family glycosyltransferase [Bacteroidales bacterium]|jgi:N-acetylglucosaminyldiphosphoundecaprenol N-acetyl-beta-D-mannosaminyltransferase|nr:WecB/TagA/CpsF family glycosyltransferase [Bacteroidales bacterium]
MKTGFYNIRIDLWGQDEALSCIRNVLLQDAHKTVFFLNAHCFNLAQKNPAYFNALQSSDYLLNDGIGISLGGWLKGIKFPDNLNGTDFIPLIINEGYIASKTFYFLGTKDYVLEKAKAKMEEKFPGIKIVGMHNGFFPATDSKDIVHEINRLKADIVIVGMGVPRQEIWIHENKNELPGVKLFIAGGAVLDFLSGTISRAPLWMRQLRIEWIYRLCLEPKRMWRRYIIGNVLFFYNIHVSRKQKNKNNISSR